MRARIHGYWLAFALAACGQQGDGDVLLQGEPPDDKELDERQEERTRSMNITVETLDENGVVISTDDLQPEALAEAVYDSCAKVIVPFNTSEMTEAQVGKLGPCSFSTVPDFGAYSCTEAMCRTHWNTCAASKTLEILEGVGTVRLDTIDDNEHAVHRQIPAVRTEAKAALAELAGKFAATGAGVVGTNLRSFVDLPEPASISWACYPNDSEMNSVTLSSYQKEKKSSLAAGFLSRADWEANQQTLAEFFAMSLVELVQLARDAAEAGVKHHLAVADAERGRTSNAAVASQLSWTDPVMSRARAAHMLVGGGAAEQLHYFWGEGMCPAQNPDADTRRAIDILRQAGGPPSVVRTDLVTVTRLLEGDASAPQEAIRARLAERLEDPSLLTMSAEELAAHFDLDLAAFAKARDYMRHEVKAFGRDVTFEAPASALAYGDNNGVPVARNTTTKNYAALSTPPSAPPSQYYNALTRYAKAWRSAAELDHRVIQTTCTSSVHCSAGDICSSGYCIPEHTGSVIPSARYASEGLIQTIDYAGSVAHDLLAYTSQTQTSGAILGDTAANLLAALSSDVAAERPARLEVCAQQQSYVCLQGQCTGQWHTDTFRFRVMGATEPSRFKVVSGVDGLRCAVHGNVDEAPCTLTDETFSRSAGSFSSTQRRYGFSGYVELELRRPQGADDFLFVVRRKEGAPDAPGGYEQYGYFLGQSLKPTPLDAYRWATDSWAYCMMQPIAPEHEFRASAIIAPSEDNCSQPNETCAGFEFAERIPLENELTDNGDGVENSWRHYLELAENAANFADTLGEELINHGLALDDRIEQTETDLEGICSTVDLRALAWGSLSNARGGTCSVDDPKACGATSGYACMNGQCVRNLDEAVADLAESSTKEQSEALAACVGNDSISSAVALGTQKLCAWHKNDSNAWCPEVEGVDTPCPYVAKKDYQNRPGAHTAEQACDKVTGLPADYKLEFISDTLDLFEPLGPGNDDPEPEWKFDCGAIRRARKGEADVDDKDAIKTSLDFQWARLQSVASRVGWQAYPNDYSAITVDGQVKWSTGYPLVQAANVDAAEYEGAVWPCGGPDYSVTEDVGENRTGCGTITEDSLFESYTCDCANLSSDGAKERARMNYRMGRAVLALRTITATGLHGLVAPYQPDAKALVWAADGDAEACNDGSAPRCDYLGSLWRADSLNTAILVGGRNLTEATGITYHVKETDGRPDDTKDLLAAGKAYCSPLHRGEALPPIWHHYEHLRSDAVPRVMTATCDWHNHRGKHDGTEFAVLFREYDSVKQDVSAIAAMWKGVGANSDNLSGGKHVGLIKGMLDAPSSDPEVVQIGPTDGISDYFQGCYYSYASANDLWGRHESVENCEVDIVRSDLESYNRSKLAPQGLTERDIFDALELVCTVAQEEGTSCLGGAAATPRTFGDLALARKQLECMAGTILKEGQFAVVRDVPKEILPDQASTHAYEGERGAEVANLVAAFQDLKEFQSNIGHELSAFADDIEKLRLSLRHTNITGQLAKLDRQSTMFSQLSACTASLAQAAGGTISAATTKQSSIPGALVGGGGAAVATCANSVAQIALAYQRLELQQEQLEVQDGMTWQDFRTRFRDHHEALNGYADKVRSALHRVSGAVAAVEAQRQKARRALGKGLLWSSDEAGRQFATNTVMRARYNTTLERYQNALDYAKRTAYLARRALEQRLGMELSSITEDLALVERPSSWVDGVCTLTGINYEDISSSVSANGTYTEGYIGDYVRKLRAVFESYSIDYSFGNGPDTAVISLRDDIALSRAFCPMAVNNALERSADLDMAPWGVENCDEFEPPLPVCEDGVDDDDDGFDDVTGEPIVSPIDENDDDIDDVTGEPVVQCGNAVPEVRSCATVRRLSELNSSEGSGSSLRPIPFHHQQGGAVDGFRVTFGGAEPEEASFIPRSSSNSDYTALTQRLALSPGTYRLSYRGRMPTDLQAPLIAHDPGEAVSVRGVVTEQVIDEEGNVISETQTLEPLQTVRAPVLMGYGWPLYYLFFTVSQPNQEVRIEISPRVDRLTTHVVDVGAFMLEQVAEGVSLAAVGSDPQAFAPGGYTATREPFVANLQLCEDTTGEFFRQGFRRGCARICPGGLDTCPNGVEQCYWERTFTLPLEDIESKSKLSRAGFAYGNFNYRIESIGVNFTGTATRDCSTSQSPSTCYSAAYIPYSLYHSEDFKVRNHRGEVYDAPLFRGAIESARGLAAERYITNPISSADEQLLQSYVRREMAGRPLSGKFVLRVWDADGVNFGGIEDAQLILKYGYWTRNK